MPKPDPAGRTFPVQSPSLPTPAPAQSLPELTLLSPSKDGVPKSRRDYWAMAFATPLIAAILLLGWRAGKILLAGPGPVPMHSPSSMQTGSLVPKTALPKAPLNGQATINPRISPNSILAKTTVQRPRTSPTAAHNEAQSKIAEGPVVIRALVGRDGKVQVARVIHGNRRLSVPALAMVRQLNFNPYAPHGTPLEFETEVTVSESGARGSSDGIQFSIPRESGTIPPAATPVAVEKPSK
jgi:outer membrane biosynthesis protein TonB